MPETIIKVENLYKSFDSLKVLDDINFKVDKGEVVVIIGPSGSGKSTLLRCLNYLTEPTSGVIRLKEKTVDASSASKEDIHYLRSHTSMVFQGYNLFKNKTALENVMESPIISQKRNKSEVKKASLDLLEQVGMLDRADHYPSELSGGQQQRVAIARAVAVNPEVLLFDEPTSALDPEWVNEVLRTISSLAKSGSTMVIVTHEIEFAKKVADKIIFIDKGTIQEYGSPAEVIENPTNQRLKEFLYGMQVQ